MAASGLEVFSRSKGLMEMLSDDTLNIMDIDVNRPFILTVIIGLLQFLLRIHKSEE